MASATAKAARFRRYASVALPRADYKRCWNCGRRADEVGELSHTRLCPACSVERQVTQQASMFHHSGPVFLDWRRRVAASVGAILREDLPPAA